jgi:hypothetical protein
MHSDTSVWFEEDIGSMVTLWDKEDTVVDNRLENEISAIRRDYRLRLAVVYTVIVLLISSTVLFCVF